MAKQLQLRRGTTSQNDAFTGAIGEMTMDTQKKNIRLHDGSTQGGCGTIDPVVAFWRSGTNWYRKYASGWVEQGGTANLPHGTSNAITLHITMADTNYSVIVSGAQVGSDGGVYGSPSTISAAPYSVTQFKAGTFNTASATMRVIWEVRGMAA